LLFGAPCSGSSPASQIVCILTNLLVIAIIARALLSWFNMDPRSPLIQALNQITEPILEPIRRIMPRLGMIDLSPMIAIFLLIAVSSAVQQALG
jgi:YggT family protein